MTEIVKISLIAFMFCALGAKGMIFNFYQRAIKNLPWYIYKPLGGCYLCFTGEVCFWFFIFTHRFQIVGLLFFTAAGIFCALIYKLIWTFSLLKIKQACDELRKLE